MLKKKKKILKKSLIYKLLQNLEILNLAAQESSCTNLKIVAFFQLLLVRN